MRLNIRSVSIALMLCLVSVPGRSEQKTPQKDQQPQQKTQPKTPQKDQQQQMRGLDEEVQGIKSDVLKISQELRLLEEKLLYPSGTQVAVFVALAKDDSMRLDAVRLQIDGQLVTHYIYSCLLYTSPSPRDS